MNEPKKLKAFADKHGGMYAQSSRLSQVAMAPPLAMPEPEPQPWEALLDEGDEEEISEDLDDEMSPASMFKRKLEAKYVEVRDGAGGLACQKCTHFLNQGSDGEGVCMQIAVRAPVEAETGHCMFFEAADASAITWPPNLEAPGDDGSDEPHEDASEEAEDDVDYGP
jgi:hypothetical protein